MNHSMAPPPASTHVDILTQAGEEAAPEEHSLHTFVFNTVVVFINELLKDFLFFFNGPYFLFPVCWNRVVNVVEEIVLELHSERS